ncbi:hypothetical protein [Actinoallomurus acaciae]|uniref:PE family protein n=1 Tax=Actinoallomurus acaciae TaxID=502577 RepID=A0ABV5Y9L0_9ACTN
MRSGILSPGLGIGAGEGKLRMGVNPEQPKYGPPFKPDDSSDSSPPDPDKGKDLWSLVPEVAVPAPWNGQPGPPSFNEDVSSGDDQDSDQPKYIPECPPFHVDLGSLRNGMASMIGTIQAIVPDYEHLKGMVRQSIDNEIYGQHAIVYATPNVNPAGGGVSTSDGGSGPSPIQESAQDFAAVVDPAQERALELIANAVELVGQFIALVDKSGQSYGEADRNARFPPPPVRQP